MNKKEGNFVKLDGLVNERGIENDEIANCAHHYDQHVEDTEEAPAAFTHSNDRQNVVDMGDVSRVHFKHIVLFNLET